jgi:hypothetical protein
VHGEEFSVPPLRAIYRFLQEYTGREEGLARALSHHPDPVVRQVATGLFIQGGEEFVDPQRMAQDCLVRLRLKDIQDQLRRAREEGDLHRVKALLEQKRTLATGRMAGTDYIS